MPSYRQTLWRTTFSCLPKVDINNLIISLKFQVERSYAFFCVCQRVNLPVSGYCWDKRHLWKIVAKGIASCVVHLFNIWGLMLACLRIFLRSTRLSCCTSSVMMAMLPSAALVRIGTGRGAHQDQQLSSWWRSEQPIIVFYLDRMWQQSQQVLTVEECYRRERNPSCCCLDHIIWGDGISWPYYVWKVEDICGCVDSGNKGSEMKVQR